MADDYQQHELNLLHAASAPTIEQAALEYSHHGIDVLPILKGEKFSGLNNWQNIGHVDDCQIHAWYSTGKYGGVALRPVNGLVYIDCDGAPVYEAFCARFPDLAETYTEKSGSQKGYHIFLQVDRLPTLDTGKVVRKGILGDDDLGLEIFFNTGAVVVSPSVHPSGNRYAPYKALPVLHVADIDELVAWAYTLETKQERERQKRAHVAPMATRTNTGGLAPRNRQIAPALVADIERALGITSYKANGYSKPIRCILANHEHDDTRPAAAWHGSTLHFTCRKCNESIGAHETARLLGFDVDSYYEPRQQKREAAPAPELTADLTVCTHYIELPADMAQRVIAVKSDVGTGKTKANIEAARRAESVMVLTHREKLAQNIVEDANRAGVTLEHYKELARKDWRRVGKLGICINSYATQAKDGLPVPDLLEIDEIEQMLEHIYGEAGTFSKGEAVLAGEALAYAIRTARRVIVSDAHLSDVAIEYLKANRPTGDVLAMVNTHVADRGALYTHAKKDSAIAAGINLVLQNCGVVAFAYGSEKEARTFATTLSEMVGPDSVLLLRRHNAGGERQQAFLKDPNKEIGKYRAVVYSPVIGTGFDITADVRAVIGIMGAHLTAYDARQMVGRCRAARELHVWLPNTTPTREESAAAIEALELERAEYSHVRLNSAGYAVPDIPQNQRDYVHWHALVMARRNRSLNRLREHFIELSPGYKVQHITAEDAELRQRLQAAAEDAEQQRKALVLTVAPIDREKYQQLENIGTIDDTSAAGYLRWKIEMTAGVTINERVRDALWSSQQRQALVNFTDLLDEVAEVCLHDAREEAEGVPIPKRKYRRIRRTVRAAFLNALIDGRTGRRLTSDEFNAAILPLIDKYGNELRLYFGWRRDQCKGAPAIAKRVLRTIGLNLESDQHRVNGERVRFYQIGQVSIDTAYELGRARRSALEQRRHLERGEDCCLKTHIDAVTSPDVSFKTGPLPPLPRVTPDHMQALGQRLIALHQTTNRSAIT